MKVSPGISRALKREMKTFTRQLRIQCLSENADHQSDKADKFSASGGVSSSEAEDDEDQIPKYHESFMYYVSLAIYTSRSSVKFVSFLFIAIDANKSVSVVPMCIFIFYEVFDRPL